MPAPSSSSMDTDPIQLTEARSLLGRYESSRDEASARGFLVEALVLLAEARDEASSDAVRARCIAIATSYAAKLLARVRALLQGRRHEHWEHLEPWYKAMYEFSRCGFEIDESFNVVRSELLSRIIEQQAAQLSDDDLQLLIQKLEQMKNVDI